LSDNNDNLYIFSGSSGVNDLWKFEPDISCIGITLDAKSLIKPKKTSICTSNDSVVMSIDTALFNVSWNPSSTVTVNADTSLLVFKPTVQTYYTISAHGGKCVAIDTLKFTVRIGSPTYDTIIDTTCLTGKYPYNKSGIYDYVIRNASGCDSNIHLNLTIRDYIDTSYVDICKGGSFIFYGKTYSTTGTYSKIFKNQFNCDSTKVMVLKVVSPDTIYVKQTICQGDTLLYRGNKYATSGEYNFSRGCGMDVLSLWVRPKDSFVIFDTFCSGDTFKYQIHRYTTSGTYSHKYISTDGCDSFMVFNLHVKTKTSDTIRIDSIILDNLCSINNKRIYIFPLNIDFKNKYSRDFGYNYQPASIFYNLTAGTYPIRIKRGCAFLDTPVTLPYRERDTSVINDETCVIFPYYFNNQYITKSGIYWDTFTNVYNCDSFIKLNLVVHKTDSFTIRDTICRGDTVMFDGFARTAAGTYYQYIKLFEGCDSTVKFILTVKRRDTMIHNRTICRGDTLYFSGNKYTEAGSYKLSYINKEGCDSFVHLNLTVKRRDTFLFHDTICSGAIKLFEGIAHTSNGNYVYKLLNGEGCDSFRILNLVVHRQDTNNLKYSKCIDDSIVHGGVTYKTTGVHNKLYKNIFKCDSLVILDLKFSAFESQTLNKNICPGDMFEGYKSAGTHYDTFKRTGKCDSIRELILSHLPIPVTKLTASICQTQTYTYRSKTFKTKGVFFDTIVTSKNCDSIIEIDLKVKDSSSFSYSHFICKSETYLFNNQNLNRPGFYKDTLINYLGCDSFVYLTLGYRPPIQDSVKAEICFGENFRGYTTTGIYKDTIQTALGCDSILKIDLKVLVGPYPYEQKLEDCKSVLFKNKLYTNSILIHDTLYNKLNCDSVYRKTDILIRPKPIKRPLENLTFCDSIRMSDGKVYRFNFSYQDTIRTKDTLACDSLYFPKLLEKKSKVNMTISIVPMFDEYFKGEKVELTTYPAKKLFWTTGDTIARINLVLNEDQSIEVIGWDSEECKDTASINLRVIEPGLLDIPKAFAPYGMIENRLFKPNFKGMVEINRFEIYNRWGEKIYSTNTKENIGWDGTYKGEDVPSGLFTFLLEYKVNRSIFFKTGEVLLVR
jgi:gliding motility-associated-like protein